MSRNYWVHLPGDERHPLPTTLFPSTLSPTAVTHNLVRARGYTQVYQLDDGLPDPAPFQLSGTVRFNTEDELSLSLTELRGWLQQATHFSRDQRVRIPVLSARLDAAAAGAHSGAATITVTFILAAVPTADAPFF